MSDASSVTIFDIVADPTRRRILELLCEGDLVAGAIGVEFALSQPAVSKHLRVLRESGVVSSHVVGQRRLYRLEPEGLRELDEWVDARRAAWKKRHRGLASEGSGSGRRKRSRS